MPLGNESSHFVDGLTVRGGLLVEKTANHYADVGGSIPVSVRDFGATGDGLSDDSAAFTAALAVNGAIFVPAGTYVLSLGTIGSQTTGGCFRIFGAGEQQTILKPLNATTSMFKVVGTNTNLSDSFEMRDVGITNSSDRAYSVPLIDLETIHRPLIRNVRVDTSIVTGTVFRLNSIVDMACFRDCHFRTGKWTVPVDVRSDVVTPGSSIPQVDTYLFENVIVTGSCGVLFRTAGLEMHGVRFDGFKVVNSNYYIAPNTETTLSSSPSAGASTFTVSSGTGFAANDAIIVGSRNTRELHKVVSVVGTTVTLTQPLQFAQSSGEPMILGGCAASFATSIHSITMVGCHFEAFGPAVCIGSSRTLAMYGCYNGAGELVRIEDNTQQVLIDALHTRGTSAKHTLISRPSYAFSSTDADWSIRGPVSIDSGAPLGVTYVSTNAKTWKSRESGSGTPPIDRSNCDSAGTNLHRVVQNAGSVTLSEYWSGELVATGGVATLVKAGAPVDGDFAVPVSGMLAVDTTNSKLYVRVGSTWKSVTVA